MAALLFTSATNPPIIAMARAHSSQLNIGRALTRVELRKRYVKLMQRHARLS
jgi:hypothetical protein